MKHISYIDRYFDGSLTNGRLTEIKEIRKSKVYGERLAHSPSGWKTFIKVWNTRLNKMVEIRKDTDLVEVIN